MDIHILIISFPSGKLQNDFLSLPLKLKYQIYITPPHPHPGYNDCLTTKSTHFNWLIKLGICLVKDMDSSFAGRAQTLHKLKRIDQLGTMLVTVAISQCSAKRVKAKCFPLKVNRMCERCNGNCFNASYP